MKIDTKIQVYGSMATGLAIDSSDLDILVSNFIGKDSPRFHHLSRQDLIIEMQGLYQSLNKSFGLKSSQLIESASVPVIKLTMNLVKIYDREIANIHDLTPEKADQIREEIFTDAESKVLQIDITLDEPRKSIIAADEDETIKEHLGVQCCNYIKQQIAAYPQLKTLALVFKKFLALKDLNKPYTGGLSSYSLVQMILVVLKMEQQFGFLQDSSFGMIFKHIVFKYGYGFNTNQTGIGMDAFFHDKNEFMYMMHK